MFEKYGPAGCEWDLMLKMRAELGDDGTSKILAEHRERYITEDDFRCIAALGLNAVRIPFGYWVAVGPAEGDPYAGPGLEHLDRALDWCKAYGLQAVLDLHGAPGGESGERPCGRERKEWQWQDWRFDESVAALRVVATRYRGHPAVSGISVCNEPSETVPAAALCQFYDRAVRAIREAGMRPDEAAIILPVYRTERLDEVWRLWSRDFDGFATHANITFDLHLYHCFGTWWQRQGLANQLRMTKRHRKILRRVPAVVGEWSLALPPQARGDGQLEEDQALRAFAEAQAEAYSQASHGWFFWTWRDSPLQQPGWDLRKCLARRWLNKNQLTDKSQSRTSRGAENIFG
jgi:glucan 1,3-beta-glucosidase